MNRIEQQLERTNSLCELVVVEQRRLAMVTDSLLSAVSDLQGSRQMTAPSGSFYIQGTPPFPLSSLPMNSIWNDGSEVQVLGQAVSQCCHLLTQLQRDLTSVQQSLDSGSSPHQTTQNAKPQSPFMCNMDRFNAEATLNNRVPPGTRTNNYWDNFRSYSRQNLLSAPSNVAAEDHLAGLVLQPAPSRRQEANVRRSDPPRRTKRKVNKGQRQLEIGVRSPHADNRALAYGLSVRGAGSGSASGPVRNLNAQQTVNSDYNEIVFSSAPDAPNNKVVKDTSTLKYSGARPKENRLQTESLSSTPPPPPPPPPPPSNDNLLTKRELTEALDGQGLDTVIRTALAEHSTSPQFVSQLLRLLQKFSSDPLRQTILENLQGMISGRPSRQSELDKVFDMVVANQLEFTPNLLETFLGAIQQSAEDCDQVEGATAVLPGSSFSSCENIHLVRHALTPFLFRRLSEVRDFIGDILADLGE